MKKHLYGSKTLHNESDVRDVTKLQYQWFKKCKKDHPGDQRGLCPVKLFYSLSRKAVKSFSSLLKQAAPEG